MATMRAQSLLQEAAEAAGGWPPLSRTHGVPDSTLRAYAEGRRRPGLDQAVMLRDRLGIPLDAWVEPADQPVEMEAVAS